MGKIIKLKQKRRRSRQREELLEEFSQVFPECRDLAFEQEEGLEAVFCPHCGSCLIRDPRRGIITVGVWIHKERTVSKCSRFRR